MTDSPQNLPSITCCITELDIGGAEKALARLATGLRDLGWRVRVVSLRDAGPVAEMLRADGIDVCALNCGGFSDIRCFWRLQAELRRNPTDVLLCFLHQANIYGRLAGRAAEIPTVVSGIRVADRRSWVTTTDRLTTKRTDHYVAVSQAVGNVHQNLCSIAADRMTVIPNGVDGPAVVRTADDRKQTALFVGRLCAQKNPLCLLDAWTQLQASLRVTWELHFVGEGELKEPLCSAVQATGLQESVFVHGHRTDVPDLMTQSGMLILPSLWEGMPNAVLEAMACGLPVIATAVDGCVDLVTPGSSGWLIPPNAPQRLSAAIEEAMAAPAERDRRAANAHAVVRSQFQWASVIQQYDSLLRSLRQAASD